MTFSPMAAERLGWYVYLLSDPRTTQIFYVGKGKGSRAFAHAADAVDNADHPELQSAKHQHILDIHAAGQQVGVLVLRHGIDTEKQAYVVEAAAIDLVNRLQPGQLLNVVLGHHHAQHGLMSASEIEVLYAAPEAPTPDIPIMLVSLNQVWTPTITPGDLKEQTTHWWRAGGVHRRRPAFIMGVHNGVVRSVYRPTTWRSAPDNPARWGCQADEAPEMGHWLGTSVKRYLTAKQWSVRYLVPGE